ncbi:MAG: phosphatase PAP2 family protein [Clostridia bacterium]|nr:phosphatase PAP2 family protein [Clostridia bacterium]
MKIIDYRKLRPSNLTDPYFRHLLLLIWWIPYGITFWCLERFIPLDFQPVWCVLDDKIPFHEWFVIPYYFWFVFLIGMLVYTGLTDVPSFKKMMWFIIITYTITTMIYIVYPNRQDLRPTVFPRDNILVDIAKHLYSFDTNTNVCPSLHVVGSFATCFTAWHSKQFRTPVWRIVFTVVAVLISLSTLFLRQHSVIDVAAGLVLSFSVYPFVYFRKDDPEPTEPWLKKEPVATKTE